MNPLGALARYPLFTLAGGKVLREWVAAGHVVSFSTGEMIFREGSSGEWAYFLMGGRVRVLRRAGSGREVTLGALEPGEVFGEYALLAPGLNTASCRASSDSVVLQLPLAGLRTWLSRSPFVASRLKNWLQLHFLLRHLRNQTFLGFMSATSALAMLAHLTPLEVPAQTTVQANGLCDDRWLFLEEGEVVVEGDSPRTLRAGDFLGEPTLAAGSLPTAVALTPIRCQTLPRDFFIRPDRPALSPIAQTSAAEVLDSPSRVRWVGQRERSDCGVASLAMVAQYHGLAVSTDEIRRRVNVGPEGATLGELARAATSLGLAIQTVRVGAGHFRHVHVPAVVHLNAGHYVVLFRLDASGALVGDPATGIVTISVIHFVQSASGNLLLLRPLVERRD